MNKIPDIAIYIPDAEAQKWLVFQQHYEVFDVLLKANVFGQTSAAITLNFDHDGVLQTIDRKDQLYSARYPLKKID